jgi:5-methylcytosine-specific restriction endonuclease McrA
MFWATRRKDSSVLYRIATGPAPVVHRLVHYFRQGPSSAKAVKPPPQGRGRIIQKQFTMTESFICALCHRLLKSGSSRHHLIPRACHRRSWFRNRFTKEVLQTTVDVCRDCHSAIHDLIPDERELGRSYYTIELLQAHPAIEKYLVWVRKQK